MVFSLINGIFVVGGFHEIYTLCPADKTYLSILLTKAPHISLRFNEMFGQDRLDAMDTLARYSSERENNQRIIFAALQVRLGFANKDT